MSPEDAQGGRLVDPYTPEKQGLVHRFRSEVVTLDRDGIL
jgi:hypothetical protein